ncbi:MAG: hypothetical protein Q7T44_12060 [Parvibaculum sp.]|nr:hypothetical protein [Parvibaculum sp.]
MNNLILLLNRRAEIETVVGRKIWTSVKVHDLFVPASALQSRLNKFGQNLVVFTNVDGYEVQLIGSATGLHYRGTNFLVCTAHQVKDSSAQDVGIVVPERSSYLSSAGFTRFRATDIVPPGDAEDLYVFDFTPQATSNRELVERFFRLNSNDFLRDKDDVVAYLAYGCPFVDQKYNIVDENHVGLVIRSMTCEPQAQPADLDLGLCRLLSPMDFDPNGLSGGPVFATVLQDHEVVLKFAGVINRSGNGLIYFIKAKAVQKLLDLTFGHSA